MLRAALFAVLLAFIATTTASAHDYKLGALEIQHPWARATPKGAKVAGGYLKIVNTGPTADRLIGGSAVIAGKFEIHEMRMVNGVMQMRPLPNGLEIKPGETVELKPGHHHVMFMDIKAPFEDGKRVKGTLVFEKAGKIDVEYAVEKMVAAPGGHQHHH